MTHSVNALDAPAESSMIGTTVGHFRLVERLGRGTSGTVYRAVDEVLGREVALKILNHGHVDPDAVTRFRAEATTLATLNHPAIATIYELVESDGHLAMAMECVRGETLDQLSARVGLLPPERAAFLIERILAALDHAHRAGVLHRDIKPANVMVNDGEVKITDFGIARMVSGQHSGEEGLLGTPDYMAPEQVLGEPLDARTDLYAVGAILYRLLTATLPFEADTPSAVLRQQVEAAPPPLRTRRDDLPAWCEPIVQRALAKRSADRFQTADQFRDALTRAVAPAPASWYRPAAGWRRRSVYAALALASAATVVLLMARPAALRPSAPPSPPARQDRRLAAAATPPATRPTDAPKLAPEHRTEKPTKTPLPELEYDTKAFVADGSKTHERSARLLLADRKLTVIDEETGRLLYSVPYESVASINYSHSRDPLWASPDGPAPVIRTTGGVFRMFGISIDRTWVSLVTRTSDRFIVFRVADGEVTELLTALQERTHRTVKRVGPTRGDGGRPIL